MKQLIVQCFIAITALLLITSVAGCKQQPQPQPEDIVEPHIPSAEYIEVILIYNAQSPDYPPPPGGWTFQTTGPYPTRVQRLFDPGDKIFLGLVISEQIEGEFTFSRATLFNRNTATEQEIAVPPDDLGPFEPGWKGLLGFVTPWEVPGENGEYELRLYTGEELAASALFNVGVWPASWGPEMIKRPAPIYEVRVILGQEEPKVDVAVYIKGGLPQGCEATHWYSVEPIIDDTIYIEVGIRHLKDVPCEDYVYFEETVNLWPSLLKNFTPGETYKVNVNGYITTFIMPQTN